MRLIILYVSNSVSERRETVTPRITRSLTYANFCSVI